MIRIDLTPEQRREARSGSLTLTEEQALSVRGKLTAAAGAGRQLVLRPCKMCGTEYSAREMRKHVAHCPSKDKAPRKRRAAAEEEAK